LFPERPVSAIAEELRAAWVSGRTVVLALDATVCISPRVGGRVVYVAVTGAYALVDDGERTPLHVPLTVVLGVRRPHFSEPTDVEALTGPGLLRSNQLPLPGVETVAFRGPVR
jgi:hypothetical protein